MWQHQGDFPGSHEHIWQSMPASQAHFSKPPELWLALITCSSLTDINWIPACAYMPVWMRASAGNQLLAPWGSTSRWQGVGRGRAIPGWVKEKNSSLMAQEAKCHHFQCKYQPCPSSWLWQNKTLSHPKETLDPMRGSQSSVHLALTEKSAAFPNRRKCFIERHNLPGHLATKTCNCNRV